MLVTNPATLTIDDTVLETASTVEREVDYSALVLFAKQADTPTAKVGDTVTYTITIIAGAIGVTAVCATMADPLHENLQYVEGSLTIDGESSDLDISNMTIELSQNQTVIITYQCIML